eukprot:scaffold302744_cov20-Prasinocladus_malaysianus.AAC.1
MSFTWPNIFAVRKSALGVSCNRLMAVQENHGCPPVACVHVHYGVILDEFLNMYLGTVDAAPFTDKMYPSV